MDRVLKIRESFLMMLIPKNACYYCCLSNLLLFLDLLLRITMPKPTAAIIPRVAKIKRNSGGVGLDEGGEEGVGVGVAVGMTCPTGIMCNGTIEEGILRVFLRV
jgi:hypothetical protein